MLRKSLMALVLLALASGIAWAQQQWTAVPGVGAGPIKVGMNIKQVEQILTRKPNAPHAYRNKKWPFWVYYNEGLQVAYLIPSGKVDQVVVDKPGIPTDKGVEVGGSLEDITNAYGHNYIDHELPTGSKDPKQYAYYYPPQGIGFQLEGGKIKFIYLFDKVK
ncbi:MAG: hypothetical protein K6G50_09000 [bacterium]|nr:hypothetical protein [bacterium]